MMMRRFLTIMLLCTAISAFAQKKTEIVIFHTNDTHSCVEPLNANLATDMADKGGYLRRLKFIREQRKLYPDMLLLDDGDFSQGSIYYSQFKGEVEVKLMNMMKYDACGIGNHEFDFGLDNMARLFKMAKFKVVCCNYDFSQTCLKNIVKPYIIVKRGGKKIGITGVSPRLAGLVAHVNYGNAKYIKPSEAVNKVTKYLHDVKKCDVIICISHLGWDILGSDNKEFIPETHYIDYVVGGHSHTYFTEPLYVKDADGKEVPDFQMGKSGRWVAKSVLEVE
jgi:5'-nucleotidase